MKPLILSAFVLLALCAMCVPYSQAADRPQATWLLLPADIAPALPADWQPPKDRVGLTEPLMRVASCVGTCPRQSIPLAAAQPVRNSVRLLATAQPVRRVAGLIGRVKPLRRTAAGVLRAIR